MFKVILKKYNIFKSFLGKYIPTPIKKEYKTMKNGIDTIADTFYTNYSKAKVNAKMRGKTSFIATQEGLTSAIAQTRITKNEIPPLFAIAGGCSLPYPGTTEAGYAIGKILTSKPAATVYTTGKKAVVKTYSAINNVLKI